MGHLSCKKDWLKPYSKTTHGGLFLDKIIIVIINKQIKHLTLRSLVNENESHCWIVNQYIFAKS